MLYGTFTRRIRKPDYTVFFQCNSFNFHQNLLILRLHIEIKSGILVCVLRLYKYRIRHQSTGADPFLRYLIRRLGIHIDKSVAFLYRDKIPSCLTLRVIAFLYIHRYLRLQKFRTASCIFHMNSLCTTGTFHISNKPVRSVYKTARINIRILHFSSVLLILPVLLHTPGSPHLTTASSHPVLTPYLHTL